LYIGESCAGRREWCRIAGRREMAPRLGVGPGILEEEQTELSGRRVGRKEGITKG